MKVNEDMIECFALIVFYNGYEDIVNIWRHNMHICATEMRPFYFSEGYNYDGSYFELGQLEILRMWLVILFGSYGTSPRSGWITNVRGCGHFLDDVMGKINRGES